MAETANTSPFDPAGFSEGGGLWDGKVVTITAAYIGLQTDNEGRPFINPETKQPSDGHGLIVKGVAEGEEKERREQYSMGALKATPDGESFCKADGSAGSLHKASNAGKFFEALAASGFDMNRIYVNGQGRVSGLVGAKIEFVGVSKLDKDGKVIVKKGFESKTFFPRKTVGYLTGGTRGNGSVAGTTLVEKGRKIVAELLAASGGGLGRADLARGVASKLKGDPDSMAIVSLVVQDSFLKSEGVSWKYDGSRLSL